MSINVIGTEKRKFYKTDGDEVYIDGNLLIDSDGVMQHGIQITAIGKVKCKVSYQNETYLKPLYGVTKIQPIMLTRANENILKPAYLPKCQNRKIPFRIPFLANKDTLLYDTYHGKYIKIKYKIKFIISNELKRCKGPNYEIVIQKKQVIEESTEQMPYIEPLEFILDAKLLRSTGSILSYITNNIYGYAEKSSDNLNNLMPVILPEIGTTLDKTSQNPQPANEQAKSGTGSLFGYIYSYTGYLTKKTPTKSNPAEKKPTEVKKLSKPLDENSLQNGNANNKSVPNVTTTDVDTSNISAKSEENKDSLHVDPLTSGIYNLDPKDNELILGEIITNEMHINPEESTNGALSVDPLTSGIYNIDLKDNEEVLGETHKNEMQIKLEVSTNDSLLVDPLISGIYTIDPKDNEEILGELLIDEINLIPKTRELNSSTCNLFENSMSTEDLNNDYSDVETNLVEDYFSDEKDCLKMELESQKSLEVDENGRRSLDSLKVDRITTQNQKENSRHSLDSSKAETKPGNKHNVITNKQITNNNTMDVILTGVLDSKICPIDQPLSGEVTVVHKSIIIKSIEVELLALETCGKSYKTDESLINVHQIAQGNICPGRPIPFHLMFPPLLTCPTIKTDTFKIEFAVRIIVSMKDYLSVSKTIPIDVIRI